MSSVLPPTLDIAIEVRPLGSLSRLEVAGDIDVRTAPHLDAALSRLIAAGQVDLVLDFTAVQFIDSSGLAVLVRALKRIRPQNGRFRLICKSVPIQKLFTITGLSRSLDIFDTEAELLSKLQG